MNISKHRLLYTNEIISILESKKICNFITNNSNNISITPMRYAFDYNNENFTFYFININNKKNITDFELNNKVCISVENYILGFYMDAYQSISAYGSIDFVDNSIDQNDILLKFQKKYSSDLKLEKHSNPRYIKVDITNILGRQY